MGGAQGLGIQWGGAQAEFGRSLWYEAALEEDKGDRRCLEIITVPLGLSPARKQLGSFPWEHLCPTMTEPYRHTTALHLSPQHHKGSQSDACHCRALGETEAGWLKELTPIAWLSCDGSQPQCLACRYAHGYTGS